MFSPLIFVDSITAATILAAVGHFVPSARLLRSKLLAPPESAILEDSARSLPMLPHESNETFYNDQSYTNYF